MPAADDWKMSKIGEVGGMEEVETASQTLAPLPSLALPAPEAGQEHEQQKASPQRLRTEEALRLQRRLKALVSSSRQLSADRAARLR